MSDSLTVDDLLLELPSGVPASATLKADLTPPHAPELPDIALGSGHLRLLQLLGEGGMGQVHAAEEPHLARVVAVKRLHPGATPRAQAALVAEARLTGRLEHPNIVPVHTLARDEHGAPIMVMKRIDGESWQALLAAGPDATGWPCFDEADTPTLRTVRLLLEVCKAVSFAHRSGVLHRDLKPANILISPHGEVTVADWGVACVLGTVVARSRLAGSPAYMAPEQLRNDHVLDESVDVFQLGATLLEALTGAPPHAAPSARAALVKASAWGGLPEQEGMPAELADICRTAMAPAPSDRHTSVDALAAALRGFLRHEGDRRLYAATAAHHAALRGRSGSELVTGSLAVRFGYRQVLASCAHHTQARDGLVSLLQELADDAISTEAAEAAEEALARLAELGAPDAERTARLAALRAQLSARRALAGELSMAAGATGRMKMAAFLAFVGGLMALSLQWVPWLRTLEGMAASSLACGIGFGLFMFSIRRRLLVNIMGRRIASTVATVFGLMVLNHTLALLDPNATPAALAADDLLLLGGGILISGFFTEGQIIALGLMLILGSTAARLLPARAFLIFGLAQVVVPATVFCIEWLRHRREGYSR